ncbi:DUF2207 domain-containing protein [Nocardioides gilvus]|uniref:DUF2207 domain-containing protein n=1 Tax=Nocardioides gilvus TaxID=1735589 RepID=UPI0013A57DB0|nr:DUF2207 domain-containing protein [Nocardioides gilvus]
MGRVMPWVLLVLLGAMTLLPVLFHDVGTSSGDQDEPTRIRQYNAVFDVDEFGDMEVTETLVVHFPDDSRRGIFRFFDSYDPNQDRASRLPRNISVARDGRAEPYEELSTQVGRYRTLKIGDEDIHLRPGDHTYVIRYTIRDVLLSSGEGSRFYWDLVPAGWAQEIDRAELTVRLPESPTDPETVQCAVGAGATDGCSVGVNGRTLTVQADSLPRNTPITVGVDLPSAPPGADSLLPWSVTWRPVLGSAPWVPLGVLAAAVFAGWFGRRIAAATHEADPRFPLQYAPPAGIGPAQALYILTESTPDVGFVANLMYAAERGAIDLSRHDDGWRIFARPEAATLQLDPSTWAATQALVPRIGSEFVVRRRDAKSGEKVQKARTDVLLATKKWARDEGLLSKAGWGSLAGIAAVAALVLYVVLLVALWSHFTLLALVPGAFFAMVLPVLYSGATTKRTTAGRHLWSQVGGFRRVLATPSSVERFEFSGRQELYTAYLPWAVVFGCAEEWAAKYRVEVGVEPPDPVYLGGMAGFGSGTGGSSFVNDFSSTVSAAVSTYQATQASSSSGGGGFSGGGGGGGGGGGSW